MKSTIEKLSNEKLEQEIANIYVTHAQERKSGHSEVDTVPEKGLLGLLWSEFDARVAERKIKLSGDDAGFMPKWVKHD